MATQPQFGVTAPLSTSLPTPTETASSDALIEELKRQNSYESNTATLARTTVLDSLQFITEEFVKHVSRLQKQPDIVINSAGGKVFTYGSFRLGVFGPGSDIDTLVVAPKHVSREDFFQYFPVLLKNLAPENAISEINTVPDSFVPIIKFEYSGISIDLIFASLASQTSVPNSLTLEDNDILRGLDDVDLRCVNGTRVSDDMLRLVPQHSIFRVALRGIKLWAKRRAIYANVVGFPGGIAWTILVARVCQLYPKATSSTIIFKFFKILEKWPWPQPVLLKRIEEGPLDARVWNPKLYSADRYHIMPIITPAYPSMCTTHNVTISAMKVIGRELRRGAAITEKIFGRQAEWKDLFAKHTFFAKDYKYYLSIVSASTTKDAQNTWSGLVESKLRHLGMYLETHPSIYLAHPFNKGIERLHKCIGNAELEAVYTGSNKFQTQEIPPEAKDGAIKEDGVTKDDTNNGEATKHDETRFVYTTTFYIGLELSPESKSLDLSSQVRKFKELCFNWAGYKPELNELSVVHTRNSDLPDDVFSEGEVKPVKKKKQIPVMKATSNNKRPGSNVDVRLNLSLHDNIVHS